MALATVASFGCGDDDVEERDGGSKDAGRDSDVPMDADVPATDARVTDGSDEDASDLADAGDGGSDSGGDSGPCLEESYIWSFVACFGDEPGRSARRVSLSEFCADYACPADWSAALAAVADCDEDADAGWDECWRATTECGANLLRASHGPDGRFLYYDPATGALVGAAVQLTDIYEECVVSEIIAGERPPICCEEPDAG